MIITISGTPGSGKSTVAKALAGKLGLKYYSVGDFRREAAAKKGMTINEYNKLGEDDFSTDNEVDEWQKKSLAKEDNFIIDGRLSFHFIPNSIKVFLKVKQEVAAERIFNEKREKEKFKSLKEALESIKKRHESDIKRYRKYYNINPFDERHYDIVVDTSDITIQEMVDKVAERIKSQ